MAKMKIRGVDYDVQLLENGQLHMSINGSMIKADTWVKLREMAMRTKSAEVNVPFVQVRQEGDAARIRRGTARALHADGRKVLVTWEDGAKGTLERWGGVQLNQDTDIDTLRALFQQKIDAGVQLQQYLDEHRIEVNAAVATAVAKLQDSEQA